MRLPSGAPGPSLPFMSFEPVDRDYSLTKLEAATRQVELAILAIGRGDYDIAITLAGAAEGMLPEIPTQEMFSTIANDPIALKRFTKKEWLSMINSRRDWLKHPTEHLPDRLDFTLPQAAFFVLRAMAKIPDWSARMQSFKEWYFQHRPLRLEN